MRRAAQLQEPVALPLHGLPGDGALSRHRVAEVGVVVEPSGDVAGDCGVKGGYGYRKSLPFLPQTHDGRLSLFSPARPCSPSGAVLLQPTVRPTRKRTASPRSPVLFQHSRAHRRNLRRQEGADRFNRFKAEMPRKQGSTMPKPRKKKVEGPGQSRSSGGRPRKPLAAENPPEESPEMEIEGSGVENVQAQLAGISFASTSCEPGPPPSDYLGLRSGLRGAA